MNSAPHTIPDTSPDTIEQDRQQISAWLDTMPDTETVAGFVPGPGIARLEMKVDLNRLKASTGSNLQPW